MLTINNKEKRSSVAPLFYRIRIQGQLDTNWADWFEGLVISIERGEGECDVTTLTGAVVDQAALHGILAKIRDLNLVLLSIDQLEPNLK